MTTEKPTKKQYDEQRIEELVRNQAGIADYKDAGFESIFFSTRGSPDTPYIMPKSPGIIHGINHFLNCYSWDFKKALAVSKFFNPSLKDRRIADLGAGLFGCVWNAQIFSALAGAKEYTAVDLYCDQYAQEPERLQKNTRGINNFLVPKLCETDPEFKDFVSKNLESSCINEDMLRYLSKQPDESANIILNGVDLAIINQREYIDELRNQIARVVPKGGYALGFNSPHLLGLEKLDFERIKKIPGYGKLSEEGIDYEVANNAELVYRKESK